MADFVIQTSHLVKKYEDTKAIHDFSVGIPEDGIIGLVGRNGSGKTTFMKICAGILDKTGGKIEVFGNDPTDNLEVLSNLVYLYPDVEYDKVLRLQDILRNYEMMFSGFDYEFAGRLLAYFNLSPKMKYKQLSAGMASVFNFICGISCRSKLTMFDEPVLGMDITVRKAVYEVLLRDYNEYPRTIIISSHLLSEIEGILSDILLIDNGKLILYDNIDHLRQSIYRVEGDKDRIREFSDGKEIIYMKDGLLGSTMVIKGVLGEAVKKKAEQKDLSVSAVSPEELCVYLTRENKEGELECLWQKTN